jgi:hypothetical protein
MTDTDKLEELRKPFPKEQIGQLPKGGQLLDFVGHADVTDRLLSVDPRWTWEPLGLTPEGLPALDRFGNLWIRLTVCGVTRIGVGDGKSAKELISDALRNAAMRFGVALDLWAKGDRHFGIEGHDAPDRYQIVGGDADRQKPATSVSPLDAKRAAVLTYAKANYTAPEEFAADFAHHVADPDARAGFATEAQLDAFLKAKGVSV